VNAIQVLRQLIFAICRGQIYLNHILCDTKLVKNYLNNFLIPDVKTTRNIAPEGCPKLALC